MSAVSRDESAESRDGVLKVGGTSANLRTPSGQATISPEVDARNSFAGWRFLNNFAAIFDASRRPARLHVHLRRADAAALARNSTQQLHLGGDATQRLRRLCTEAAAEAEEAEVEWDDEQEAERLAARRARKEKELAMLADSVGSGDLGLNLGSKMLKRVAGAASVQPQALE